MFTIIPVIVCIVFIAVFGVIIVAIIKGIQQWDTNNRSPVLTADARVVAKRENVSHSSHTDQNGFANTTTSTTYYATFEVAGGDRMEFHIRDGEYGLLAEGDVGRLTFQGTRYKGFERIRKQ